MIILVVSAFSGGNVPSGSAFFLALCVQYSSRRRCIYPSVQPSPLRVYPAVLVFQTLGDCCQVPRAAAPAPAPLTKAPPPGSSASDRGWCLTIILPYSGAFMGNGREAHSNNQRPSHRNNAVLAAAANALTGGADVDPNFACKHLSILSKGSYRLLAISRRYIVFWGTGADRKYSISAHSSFKLYLRRYCKWSIMVCRNTETA